MEHRHNPLSTLPSPEKSDSITPADVARAPLVAAPAAARPSTAVKAPGRVIALNEAAPAQQTFADNSITTSKYTALSFVPRNLMEQ